MDDLKFTHIATSLIDANTGQIGGVPANPRQWLRKELNKLKKSLKETPELFEARGIIVYPLAGRFIVIGGNMRLEASRELGLETVPCIVLPEGTQAEKLKEIVIKDNGSFGDWDLVALSEKWGNLPLGDWGVPQWDEGESIFTRTKPLCDATLKRIMAGLEKFVVKGDSNFLIKYNSMSQRGKYIPPSIDEPCPTVCTQSRLGVVKARFLMKNFSGDDKSKCISIEKPAGTITCKDHHSFVTVYNGKGNNVSIDESAPTVTTKDRLGLVNVAHFIDQQYGQGTPASVEQPYETDRPSPTIIARQDKRPMYAVFTKKGPSYLEPSEGDTEIMKTMKDFCKENGIADIKMRMLRIDELLPIMGFPKDYALLGTKSENKKYIGNAVECGMARQLCEALYAACAI